jgi:hypothetical protein
MFILLDDAGLVLAVVGGSAGLLFTATLASFLNRKFILHFGHLPGFVDLISGCIGQE